MEPKDIRRNKIIRKMSKKKYGSRRKQIPGKHQYLRNEVMKDKKVVPDHVKSY